MVLQTPAQAPGLLDVLDIAGIGIDLYTYLQPGDLCRLGMTTNHLRSEISNVRMDVLRSFLPIHLVDDESNDSITLSEGHTFGNSDEIRNFMVQRFDAANILVRETHTRKQSMERARYLLNYQNWCHLSLPEHTFNALAECHVDEIDPEYAERLIGYNDCRGVMNQHMQRHKFVMGWMRYLLAEGEVKSERWSWVSNHPNFRHKSVRGTGIVVTQPGSGEKIEVKWDKKFMLKGSIFDSNLHRRVPLPQRQPVDMDVDE